MLGLGFELEFSGLGLGLGFQGLRLGFRVALKALNFYCGLTRRVPLTVAWDKRLLGELACNHM